MRLFFVLLITFLATGSVERAYGKAAVDAAVAAARAHVAAKERAIVDDFRALLALPNVSTNLDDMARNADWIEARLAARDFSYERVSAGNAPYILAERTFPGAERTLLIYAHFDGQPVDPSEWATPPFTPTLRAGSLENDAAIVPWADAPARLDPEWRIYGRSAGDDKAPVIAVFAALDALAAAGITPSVNVKLILDGEEEFGSPTLAGVLAEHADKLDADVLLFCDGPMHQSRRRQLVFGVRGSTTVELTTYGPNRPLHSGHYGGWAPNPNEALVRLLAGLHDAEGNVLIPGFADAARPPTTQERAAIAAMPEMDDALQAEFGLGRRLGGETRLEERILGPAIIVKGIDGGGVGDAAANVIRSRARASLNVRIVPEQRRSQDVRAVHADLMRAPGEQRDADQAQTRALAVGVQPRDRPRRLGAAHARRSATRDHLARPAGILGDRRVHHQRAAAAAGVGAAAAARRPAAQQGHVCLFGRVPSEGIRKRPLRGGRLGQHHQTRGALVKSVHDAPRDERVSLARVRLPMLKHLIGKLREPR